MFKKLIFFLICSPLFSSGVFANSPKFNITADINYKIAEDGNTTVTQIFNITNLTSDFGLSEYNFRPNLTDVHGIKAFDHAGAISYQFNNKEIALELSRASVGVDQTYSWTLVYQTKDFVKKSGRLWQIFIPRPPEILELHDFTISLNIPQSFGNKVYVRPSPLSNNYWTKEDLKGARIYAVFDPNKQTDVYESYDFTATYKLTNSRLYPVVTEIVLPPETNYQKIFLNNLNPHPIEVSFDKSGNWLAKYQLGPNANLDVVATGKIAVFSTPTIGTPAAFPSQIFLGNSQFWEVDNEKIKTEALKLKTPGNIYKYVKQLLSYKKVESKERMGALKILGDPKNANSLEFTDLFVALCRSAGIPTRSLDGYANDQLLTSWPEFYDMDKKTWVAVDPGLEKATGIDYFNSFDFNHIALTIHGIDSQLPVISNVKITPSNDNLNIRFMPKIGIRADVPETITGGFSSAANIVLENYGPTIYTGEELILAANKVKFNHSVLNTGVILPFSFSQLKFPIQKTQWNQSVDDIIKLDFEGESRSYNVKIRPIYQNGFLLTLSILFFLGIISLIAQIARGIFFPRQAWKNNLRGKGQKP